MDHGTSLTVPTGQAGMRQAGAAFDHFCAEHDLPREATWRLRLALDEVLSNITRHGAPPDARVEVMFRRTGETLELTIADAGPAFNPLLTPAPDVRSPLETRPPGGLGIALVRGLFDEVEYRRTDRNVLVLRKRLLPGAPELT